MGCFNRHIDEVTLEKVFVEAWKIVKLDKEHHQKRWSKMLTGKNPLMAYRAKTLLKYLEKEVKEFDAEHMHETLECITVYEVGKIVVRLLDGTEVNIG